METNIEARIREARETLAREAYIREACEAYPHLPALEATLAFALAEAREACSMLGPREARTAGKRAIRDAE